MRGFTVIKKGSYTFSNKATKRSAKVHEFSCCEVNSKDMA